MLNLLLYLLLNSTTPISLEQALKNDLVQIKSTANESSPHYNDPLKFTITNKGNSPLAIEIPIATYFNPVDTEYQSFMIIEPLLVQLEAKESKIISPKAMCINQSKIAHKQSMEYKYGGIKGKNYAEVANFVRQENLIGTITGQQIIWSQSDDYPLEEITMFDTKKQYDIVSRLAKLTNKPVPPMPKETDYKRNLNAKPQVEFSGSIQFNLRKVSAVQIAMFNTSNVVVRELYNNAAHRAGPTDMSFSFDASVYQEDIYKIKLICDGQIKLELEVDNF